MPKKFSKQMSKKHRKKTRVNKRRTMKGGDERGYSIGSEMDFDNPDDATNPGMFTDTGLATSAAKSNTTGITAGVVAVLAVVGALVGAKLIK